MARWSVHPVEQHEATLELEPNLFLAYRVVGGTLTFAGWFEEGIAALRAP